MSLSRVTHAVAPATPSADSSVVSRPTHDSPIRRHPSIHGPLTADDSRHGSYAGAAAHEREGSPLCRSCEEAQREYKRRRPHLVALGHDLVVPIGATAYQLVDELIARHRLSEAQLEAATGLAARNLRRIHEAGPTTRVRRRVREQLEAMDAAEAVSRLLTHEGCVRRVQALARIGYSAQRLAELTGLCRSTVKRIQLNQAEFTNMATRERLAAVYATHSLRPLPRSKATVRTYNLAERMTWASPLAWDEGAIDDPAAAAVDGTATSRHEAYVDDVAVQRRLAGDTSIRLTPSEAGEVVRRGFAAGLSYNELERRTGLSPHRYFKRTKAGGYLAGRAGGDGGAVA